MILFAAVAFAGVKSPYTQFVRDDFTVERRADQNWLAANMVSMTVHAGTSVWLTNYISNWYGEVLDLDEKFDMSPGKYGYILASDFNGNTSLERSEYAENDVTIHYANGKSEDVTYFYDANPATTKTTKGFFLDNFDEDTEIYLVMTSLPEDGGNQMDTYQYVQQDGHDATALVSREYGTNDQAKNVRINLGYQGTQGNGHEFVALYGAKVLEPVEPKGQPLPGVLMAGILSFGSIVAGKRLRKRR